MGGGRGRTGTEWLGRLRRRLQRLNVELELGSPDVVDYLRQRGGEAVTWEVDGGKIILFRDPEPSISAVLEEVAHAFQAVQGRFADEDALIMVCKREIEAKECLMKHGDALGIPADEEAATRQQLGEERTQLERLQERWR